MNTSERDRLLLEFLDGTASPSDRSTVEAMLSSSPEWRSRHSELAGLFQELARVERALPPADLRDRVLDGIRRAGRERSATEVKSRGGWISWLTHLGPRPRVLVAASFTLGLVLGAVAMGPGLHALRGDLGVIGSMGVASTPVRLARSDARIVAWVGQADAGSRVTVEVVLPEGATAEILDPTGSSTPVALRRQSGTAGGLEVQGGRAIWTGPATGRSVVDFAGRPGASSALDLILTTSTGSSHAVLPVTGSAAP